MSATDEQLAAQMRLGHPETDGYVPPPFSSVIARPTPAPPVPWRRRAILAGIAAVVVVAVIGLRVISSSEALPADGAPTASVLSVNDLHMIATEAGVPDQAVIPVGDDTAVTVRWRNDQVELLRAKLAGTWTLTVIGSVGAPRPPASASAVVANLTCIDPNIINGPAFVFGSLIENSETTLRIHTPFVTDDARLNDGTYLFVIPAQPGEAFWIDGPNDPGAPSPWPTAPGLSEPSHAGAYFVGTINPSLPCPGFGGLLPVRPTSEATSSPPAPTPLPPGPDVPAGGLLDPANGWALTGQRLLVTADGGSTWRDITPPGALSPSNLANPLGVDFVDRQHGWMAVAEPFKSGTDPSYGRIDVWRTTDGGQHWTNAQLPKAVFNSFGEILPAVQFDFLDASHGFAFLSGNSAKGANDSDLFWTADGGRTWSSDRPTGSGNAGIEGTVGFATASDGVIVNALHGNGIVVTHDGGMTWADAVFALPPGSAGAQLFFDQPVYLDGHSGLVSIDFQADSGSVYRVYRTLDAGSSWTIATTLPTGISAISFLDQQRWIGFNGSEVVRTVDGGGTWVRSPAAGLPGAPEVLEMVDAQHGWALVGMSVCLTFKSTCSSGTRLYATVDGGSTWTPLWPK